MPWRMRLPCLLLLCLLMLPKLLGCAAASHEVDDWLDFLARPESSTGGCVVDEERPRGNCAEDEDEDEANWQASPQQNGPKTLANGSQKEQALSQLNALRARFGLDALAWRSHSRLQEAADVRALEIAEHFSHTRPDGRDCSTVLEDLGLKFRSTGENIAYGSHLGPAEVTKMWENSPGHRRNMLNRDYTEVGLGLWHGSNGQVYWVQIFLRR